MGNHFLDIQYLLMSVQLLAILCLPCWSLQSGIVCTWVSQEQGISIYNFWHYYFKGIVHQILNLWCIDSPYGCKAISYSLCIKGGGNFGRKIIWLTLSLIKWLLIKSNLYVSLGQFSSVRDICLHLDKSRRLS